MKYSSLIFLFCVSMISAQQNKTGSLLVPKEEKEIQYHRARIYYQNNIGLTRLASQGVPLDHGINKKGIYFESDFSDNDLGIAKMFGMKVEILIEDVATFYQEQNNKENQQVSEPIFKNGTLFLKNILK